MKHLTNVYPTKLHIEKDSELLSTHCVSHQNNFVSQGLAAHVAVMKDRTDVSARFVIRTYGIS